MYYKNNIKLIWASVILTYGVGVSCSSMLRKLTDNPSNSASKKQAHVPALEPKIVNPSADPDQEIAERLLGAARSIETSLAALAASQEINNVPILNTAPLLTPEGGMGHTADIEWTGPLEPLLQKIATLTNYNLKILGNPGPIPIIISINQSKAIIADILKNASLQAGNRVNLVVFPASKIIELRYKFSPHATSFSGKS